RHHLDRTHVRNTTAHPRQHARQKPHLCTTRRTGDPVMAALRPGPGGRAMVHDLRAVVDAIGYLTRYDIRWRAQPAGSITVCEQALSEPVGIARGRLARQQLGKAQSTGCRHRKAHPVGPGHHRLNRRPAASPRAARPTNHRRRLPGCPTSPLRRRPDTAFSATRCRSFSSSPPWGC
ncbi:MAG: transposase, partial [Mycobacterium sp.]